MIDFCTGERDICPNKTENGYYPLCSAHNECGASGMVSVGSTWSADIITLDQIMRDCNEAIALIRRARLKVVDD